MGAEHMILYGPPGTGKTTTLQHMVRDCVTKYGEDSMLLTSFTTNAAHELNRADANGDYLPIERKFIGTLHAHCFALLGKPTIAEKKIAEWNERNPTMRLSGAIASRSLDEPDDLSEESNEQADADMSEYQLMRARMTPRDEWPASVEIFATEWESWKKDAGYYDFTDLIEMCTNEFSRMPHGARILFLDEAQDCPPNQLALINAWARNADYVVRAGDDDQTLYQHVGASPESMIDASVEDKNKRVLDQSYRVPASIQRVAQAWIERVYKRYPKVYKPRDDEGIVRTKRATWRDPQRAIDDAEQLIADGKNVMFLTACSYMLHPLIAELKSRGLPFHNSLRSKRGDWNPLRSGNGTSMAERLLLFLLPHNEYSGDRARMWNAQDLQEWTEILSSYSKNKSPDGVLVRGAKSRIDAWAESAKIAHNFPELDIVPIIDLFADPAQFEHAFDGDLDWFERAIMAKHQHTMAYPLQILRQHGALALRETPKITVGTIHSVKGGQADCVFLFPDVSMQGAQAWNIGGDARDSIIRQFYVGCTRASQELIVCKAVHNHMRVQLPLYAASGDEEIAIAA